MKSLTRILRMSDLRMQRRSVARELRKGLAGHADRITRAESNTTDDNNFKRALQVTASRAIPLCRGP